MKTGPFEFPRGIITFCQGVYVKKSGFKRKKKKFFPKEVLLKQAHS